MKQIIINHYGKIIDTRCYEKLPASIVCPNCNSDIELTLKDDSDSILCQGVEFKYRDYYKQCMVLIFLRSQKTKQI